LAEAETAVGTLESEKALLEASLKETKDKEEKATITESIASKAEELTSAQAAWLSAQEKKKSLDDRLKAEEDAKKSADPYVLPSALAVVLSEQWDAIEQNYLSGLNEFFANLRSFRSSEIKHLSDVRMSFANFLRRPDEKQKIIGEFQTSFNAIVQDMRYDPAVKNELHLRASELKETLQEICTRKTQEADDEHTAIATDGWLEAETNRLSLLYIKAMQGEIDRCFRTMDFCKDFYKGQTKAFPPIDGTLEEKAEASRPPNISEVFEGTNIFEQDGDGASGGKGGKGKDKKGKDKKDKKDKNSEEDLTLEEDPFPKLTAIYEAAIEYANTFAAGIEDEHDEKKKGKKDKGGKGKKDKGEEMQTEQVADPERALALQKILDMQSVLTKARISRLRECAVVDLICLKSETMVTYEVMKQWTATRMGNEESAIEVVVDLVQDTIENERPFEFNFRLEDVSRIPTSEIAGGPVTLNENSWPRPKCNGMTGGDEDLIFYQNERLVAETPLRQSAVEERVSSTTFSAQQSQWLTLSFVGATMTAGNSKLQYQMGRISIDTFVDIMMRLAQEDASLPSDWKRVSREGFRQIAQEFNEDADNTVFAKDFISKLGNVATSHHLLQLGLTIK